MDGMEIAELTIQERGILATSASAKYLDALSNSEVAPVSALQQPVLMPRQRKYTSRGRTYAIEWQDYGQPLPAWFDPVMQGFVDLLTLPANWDSYGAGVIDARLVDDAIDVSNAVLPSSAPAPRVVPLSSGGLQLEWHRQGVDLEIVFDRNEEPFFYFRNRASGEESEAPLSGDASLLRQIIAKLE